MKRFLLLLLLLSFSITPTFSVAKAPADIVLVEAVQQVVYTTNTGSKYHRDSCRYLSKSKIKTTKSKAQSSGYSACKVCKP